MKRFSNLFDNCSSYKDEYKHSLKENSPLESNTSISLLGSPQIRAAFRQSFLTGNVKDVSGGSNYVSANATPINPRSSPFSDIDSIFKEKRKLAESALKQNFQNNLYRVLEIEPNAEAQEIIKAYRKLSLKYHPDKSESDSDKFLEVSEAYKILSNEEFRAIYDEKGLQEVKAYMSAIL